MDYLKILLLFLISIIGLSETRAQTSSEKYWSDFEAFAREGNRDNVLRHLKSREYYVTRGLYQYLFMYKDAQLESEIDEKKASDLKGNIQKLAMYGDDLFGGDALQNYASNMLSLSSADLKKWDRAYESLEKSWRDTPMHNFERALSFAYDAMKQFESLGDSVGLVWARNSAATIHNAFVFYNMPRAQISSVSETSDALRLFLKSESLSKKMHLFIEMAEAGFGQYLVTRGAGKSEGLESLRLKLIQLHEALPTTVEFKEKNLRTLRGN